MRCLKALLVAVGGFIAGMTQGLDASAALLMNTHAIADIGGSIEGCVPAQVHNEDGSTTGDAHADVTCGTAHAFSFAKPGLDVGAVATVDTPGDNAAYQASGRSNVIQSFKFSSPSVSGRGFVTIVFRVTGSVGIEPNSGLNNTLARATASISQIKAGGFNIPSGGTRDLVQVFESGDIDAIMPFTLAVFYGSGEWGVQVAIETFAVAFDDGKAFSSFAHTLKPEFAEFRDSSGNVLEDVTVQYASGPNPFAPVPEPSAFALVAPGLLMLGAATRRRRGRFIQHRR